MVHAESACKGRRSAPALPVRRRHVVVHVVLVTRVPGLSVAILDPLVDVFVLPEVGDHPVAVHVEPASAGDHFVRIAHARRYELPWLRPGPVLLRAGVQHPLADIVFVHMAVVPHEVEAALEPGDLRRMGKRPSLDRLPDRRLVAVQLGPLVPDVVVIGDDLVQRAPSFRAIICAFVPARNSPSRAGAGGRPYASLRCVPSRASGTAARGRPPGGRDPSGGFDTLRTVAPGFCRTSARAARRLPPTARCALPRRPRARHLRACWRSRGSSARRRWPRR